MVAAEEAAENHSKKGHVVKIDSEAVIEAVIIEETIAMKETTTEEIEEDKISMTEELEEIENTEEKADATNTDLTLRALKNLLLPSRTAETETSEALTTAPLANRTKRSQRTMELRNRNLRNLKRVPQ